MSFSVNYLRKNKKLISALRINVVVNENENECQKELFHLQITLTSG